MIFNIKRVRVLKSTLNSRGPVVYWMSRDQRVFDNWALIYAQKIASEMRQPLAVIFCLLPGFLGATLRQYAFMLRGLEELEGALQRKGIPFFLLTGEPGTQIPDFMDGCGARHLVTDFDPLRIKRQWKQSVVKNMDVNVYEVDAHNIIPCWEASAKQEFGAYTLRPKIKKRLGEFLEDFPVLRKQLYRWEQPVKKIRWEKILAELPLDREIPEVSWITPGETAATQSLKAFIRDRLDLYVSARNDPNAEGQSSLSPYFHFGQLSAQRAAIAVLGARVSVESQEAFLEELIIRRELSDNYCYYNADYDSVRGFPAWSQLTLDHHKNDKRLYLYSSRQLERAQTHDPLWNAAQAEMVNTGKMHGYLRMYWAKKILEWTPSVAEAQKIAIKLNDKYELDGRDPNGYTGIAWSLGGVHDRAWAERAVFGKIRYMNYNGCLRKFDVGRYVQKFLTGG